MAVTKSLFGKSPEGKEISLYTLSNSKGMKAAVTDLGATADIRRNEERSCILWRFLEKGLGFRQRLISLL